MPQFDWYVLMGMGGLFILLGIGAINWGGREEKGYYNSTSHHLDVREFLDHWPPRPQFGALRIGGWIAIAIGVLMIILGTVILLQQ